MSARFVDRADAGRQLGRELVHRMGQVTDAAGPPLVLGLPRGGVVVAAEVAAALGAPLDVLVVRKLGVPGQEELAFGAVVPGGHRVLNAGVVSAAGLTPADIDAVTRRELVVAEERQRRYRGQADAPDATGRTVVVVDDGVATGATLRAALDVVRAMHPQRLVVAVPVAPAEALGWLRPLADVVIVLATPDPFWAVGQAYDDFRQTDDDEVTRLLAEASR